VSLCIKEQRPKYPRSYLGHGRTPDTVRIDITCCLDTDLVIIIAEECGMSNIFSDNLTILLLF